MKNSKKIVITGGAGYIGTEVVKTFLKSRDFSEVIIFDNFSKGRIENVGFLKEAYPKKLIIQKVDIRDSAQIKSQIEKYKPNSVAHLAAIVDAFETNRLGKDLECEDVNHVAAVSFAKICKKGGVKNFIFQSTVSLYSRGEDLTEDAPKEPLSTYGRAKMLAEKKILKLNDRKFNVSILRPATAVGYNSGFRYETIINRSCIRAVYGIFERYFESALESPKSYLDIKDNAKAILFALKNMTKMRGDIFNISSFNTTLVEVASIIEKNLGEKFKYEIVKEKSINQQVYTISSDKIRKLGFKPDGELKTIIKDAINGLKKEKDSIVKRNK
jgi:UDP-glucose 4-epimerase